MYFLSFLKSLNLVWWIAGQNRAFEKYGVEAFQFLSDKENYHHQINPLEKIFPKMTKCLFKRFGPTGTIEKNDALCTVPLNILNEKIFLILWTLYWSLRIILFVGLLFRLTLKCWPFFQFLYYTIDLNIDFSTIKYLDRGKYHTDPGIQNSGFGLLGIKPGVKIASKLSYSALLDKQGALSL